MKWYKKVLCWVVGVVFALASVLTIYSMGSDLVEFFPAWLTASIVGLVALVAGTTVITIFALGIVKIIEAFREQVK